MAQDKVIITDRFAPNWPRSADGGFREGDEFAVPCDVCLRKLVWTEAEAAQEGNEACVVLSCGHSLGYECAQRWLHGMSSATGSCPFCRVLQIHDCGHPVTLHTPWSRPVSTALANIGSEQSACCDRCKWRLTQRQPDPQPGTNHGGRDFGGNPWIILESAYEAAQAGVSILADEVWTEVVQRSIADIASAFQRAHEDDSHAPLLVEHPSWLAPTDAPSSTPSSEEEGQAGGDTSPMSMDRIRELINQTLLGDGSPEPHPFDTVVRSILQQAELVRDIVVEELAAHPASESLAPDLREHIISFLIVRILRRQNCLCDDCVHFRNLYDPPTPESENWQDVDDDDSDSEDSHSSDGDDPTDIEDSHSSDGDSLANSEESSASDNIA
ncbi:hypothetical protein GGR50DRAFT_375764 [Xylaria sp. CBS 124048]|nr:hypothetical protein GGR50DRAFT_375764 [Xylaria sp. CBS 124048]